MRLFLLFYIFVCVLYMGVIFWYYITFVFEFYNLYCLVSSSTSGSVEVEAFMGCLRPNSDTSWPMC
jgi:hypothetical protein